MARWLGDQKLDAGWAVRHAVGFCGVDIPGTEDGRLGGLRAECKVKVHPGIYAYRGRLILAWLGGR